MPTVDLQASKADDLEIVQLRAFLAVLETGNHADAARRLGVSAKSIGRYIRALQERLGEGLFEKRKDYGKLTERGRIFEASSREVLALMEQARSLLTVDPVLRVGFVRMMRPLVVRAVRKRVVSQSTKLIKFRLFELTSEQQARALAGRELDIGICFRLSHLSAAKDLHEFQVSEHPYALAVPEHVVDNGKLSREALSSLLYAHPPLRLSRDVIEAGSKWLAKNHVAPETTIECELATQIIAYAGAGIGFGAVPALWSATVREGVTFVPLPGFGTSAKISMYTLGHVANQARSLRAEVQDAARAALHGFGGQRD